MNPAREFFAVEAYRLIELINAFPGQDLTPETERAAARAIERSEPGSLAAARSFERKRRRPLNFVEMGIPVGAELVHVTSGERAQVVEPKKVAFRGEVVSLTRAQRLVSGANHDVQPGRFWTHDGRTINELYDQTYPL